MKQVKRWILPETDEQLADKLAAQLQISPVIAKMLVRRGLTDVDAANRFLNRKRTGFYDPFLMKDMDKAVTRIRQGIANQEKIMVYGDYDADGATSTSLMYLTLKKLGAQVEYYIPDRFEEGYGLNVPALVQGKENGFQLVITVDNGIAAVDEVRIANELGLDLIVTDHHTPPAVLPNAYAILNPKQPGCLYPDKMLAGVGVAFKVAQALLPEFPEEFLDLAVVGTVADLAPLLDENRLITQYGLQRINQSPRMGIKALLEVCGLEGKEITAGHIGFTFGPRINAAGRLDSATYAVELLITENQDRAKELAHFLNDRNQERQEISAQIFEEAVQEIEAHPDWLNDRVLVIAKEGWNAGVIGIVASRLVERYYRPILMISVTDEKGKGSARSIHGFHLYDALNQCRDLFEHFGGHKMAAGFSIEKQRIDRLRLRLNQIAAEVLSAEDLVPLIEIDAEIDLPDLNMEFVESVSQLAPFGFGNPSPRFQLNGLVLERCRPVGQEGAHLQLQMVKGAARLGGIAFNRGTESDQVNQWQRLDLVGEITINEWNGRKSLQIIMDDWRPNSIQVFDCRHIEDKVHWLNEQAGKKDLTVICFQEESVKQAILGMEVYPWQESHVHRIYIANGEGTLREWVVDPTNESERNTETAESLAGDVILYDLPQSLHQYERVIKSCTKSCHLYLLHGISDIRQFEERKKYLMPDRRIFAGIYKILQQAGSCTSQDVQKRLQPAYYEAVDLVLSVFVELGFAVQDGKTYHVNNSINKKSLEESELYQKRLARIESYKRVITVLIQSSSEQAVSDILQLLAVKSGRG